MATPVELPQLGNTVEECIITRWLKRKGDSVSSGEIVVEIETDKTTFEVTAPVGGTVLATFFDEGALVPVFTNIFVIGGPGESVEAFRPAGTARTAAVEATPEPPEPMTAASAASRAAESPAVPTVPGARAFSPRAAKFAAAHGLDPSAIDGSGPAGRVLETDVRRAHDALTSARRTRLRARESGALRRGKPEDPSPRVARSSVAGSGAREPASPPSRALRASARQAPEGANPRAPEPADPRPVDSLKAGLSTVEGRSAGLRATIAKRMRDSLASTAQYTLNSSAAATGLLALRARIKSLAEDGGPDVTINDLVAFCTIQALLDAPDLNAEFIDGRIVPHRAIHLAFAVDTPKGLMAPVVRDAQDLAAADLARRMKELTVRAIQGTVAPGDLAGATFTISNLGSLGIESFTPLINPPQVAILGVGAIQPRPVRTAGPREPVRLRETSARRALALAGSIELVDSIGLSLTCDHQVIDGAPGARFLQVLRKKIEDVESLCDIKEGNESRNEATE